MEIILDSDGTLRNPKTLERYGWWFKVDGVTYYIKDESRADRIY
jgi:ribonucleotide reductase alpha subunit